MSEVIRSISRDERNDFQRFLERCYGSGRGSWVRWQPHLFLDGADADEFHLVAEVDGRIVSHVGGYPLPVRVGPSRVMTAGVGNVGTEPGERGKGHMTKLLAESIRRWRERGWTLSALWGDRQRYGSFGWETCGLKYTARLSARSLERAGIEPSAVEEVDPADPAVVERVAELHQMMPCRVERPEFALNLRRDGIRVFLGTDGYLLSGGDYGDLGVSEIVSPTDRAPELIAGAMDRARTGSANVDFCPGDIDRLARVVDVMSGWHCGTQGMLRIVDWPGLARDLQPWLQERAEGMASFEQSVGCRWEGETEWVTIEWDGEALSVSDGQGANAVELELPRLTGLLFGSPLSGMEALEPLAQLLPVPVHIPGLDHV